MDEDYDFEESDSSNDSDSSDIRSTIREKEDEEIRNRDSQLSQLSQPEIKHVRSRNVSREVSETSLIPREVQPEVVVDENSEQYLKTLTIKQLRIKLRSLGVEQPESFNEKLELYYDNRALWCCGARCCCRRIAIRIVENVWFDRFILFCILVNCFFLTLYDPVDSTNPLNNVLEISEHIFQAIFTLEMMVKIFAMGFLWHRNAYLRDTWNLLDFGIVIAGWLAYINIGAGFNAIRAFRVLRPLRTISGLPQLRVIINSLVKSLRMLTNVLVLFVSFICLFGIIGIQLFKGIFHRRCVDVIYPSNVFYPTAVQRPYTETSDSLTSAEVNENTDIFLCGVLGGSQKCPSDFRCREDANYVNPFFGFMNYDNFPASTLTLFTSISMEGWFEFNVYTLHASHFVVSYLFYFTLVVFGNYFIVNLALVIISESYTTNTKIEKLNQMIIKIIKKKKRLLKNRMTIWQRLNYHIKRVKSTLFRLCCCHTKLCVFNRGIITFFRRFTRKIIDSICLRLFFLFLTIANVAALGVDTPRIESNTELILTLKILNYVFLGFFTLETLTKLFAKGGDFFRDYFDIFDATILIPSYVEIFTGTGNSGVFLALRAFRLFKALRALRLFKMIKYSQHIQRLIKVIFKSLTSSLYLTLLLFVVVFISGLIGMRLFGGLDIDPAFEDVRSDFDTFAHALLTSFLVVTGENWNLVLYKFLYPNKYWNALYFIVLYVIGNYGFLNLFIAVLFESFVQEKEKEVDPEEEKTEDAKGKIIMKRLFRSSLRRLAFWRKRSIVLTETQLQDLREQVKPRIRDDYPLEEFPRVSQNEEEIYHPLVTSEGAVLPPSASEYRALSYTKYFIENGDDCRNGGSLSEIEARKSFGRRCLHSFWKCYCCCCCCHFICLWWAFKKLLKGLKNRLLGDYSLCIFPNSGIRKWINKVVMSKVFELLLMVFIIMGTLILALEDPFLPPDHLLAQILYYVNLILTIFFTIEMVLKIIALGFLFQKGSYMREIWNIMDVLIVCIAWLSISLNSDDFSSFKVIRMLRTLRFLRSLRIVRTLKALRSIRILRSLRPLRFLNKLEGLRVIVDCLLSSIPNLLSVMGFSILVFTIFAIMGVQLFGYKFRHCSVGKYEYDKQECLDRGYEWTQTVLNFDNILNAFITLFALSTLEGWDLVMYQGIDSPSNIDEHPVKDNNDTYSIFFVGFVMIGAFFLQNLFVGVLIDRYLSIYSEKGSGSLTSPQKRWINMQKLMITHKPEERKVKLPKNKFRRRLLLFVQGNFFEFVITGCILLNSVFMAMEYYGAPEWYNILLSVFNVTFTVIFCLEALLKIFAFGICQYFKDSWNVFDFTIAGISVIASSLSYLPTGGITSGLSWTSVFRLLRLVRLFRIIKTARGLRVLIQTMIRSLGELFNVFLLVFLFYFIFAILGVNLYGKLEYGEFITPNSNFENVLSAMIILFRISTGENWPMIMNETMRYLNPDLFESMFQSKSDYPDRCKKLGSCGVVYSPIYFVSFIIVGDFVLANLFVAVIMQTFHFIISQTESPVNETRLKWYMKTWMKHDPDLTFYMPKGKLTLFLIHLGEPLGVKKSIESDEINRLINNLSLGEYDGKINYHDVLFQLTKTRYGVEIPKRYQKKFDKNWNKLIPPSQRVDIHQIIAALKVKHLWLKKVKRRREMEKKKKETLGMGMDDDDDDEIQFFQHGILQKRERKGHWLSHHDENIDSFHESCFSFTDESDRRSSYDSVEMDKMDDSISYDDEIYSNESDVIYSSSSSEGEDRNGRRKIKKKGGGIVNEEDVILLEDQLREKREKEEYHERSQTQWRREEYYHHARKSKSVEKAVHDPFFLDRNIMGKNSNNKKKKIPKKKQINFEVYQCSDIDNISEDSEDSVGSVDGFEEEMYV